jgi:hypothetical protein
MMGRDEGRDEGRVRERGLARQSHRQTDRDGEGGEMRVSKRPLSSVVQIKFFFFFFNFKFFLLNYKHPL